jgi:parallel beta-helix repeat protein
MVKNVTLRNVTAYNAWNDNSIDFSVCCNENITITDSKIHDSRAGIRATNVDNMLIKNSNFHQIKETGVRVENSKDATIDGLTVYSSKKGVSLENAKGIEIKDFRLEKIGENGIEIRNSSRITLINGSLADLGIGLISENMQSMASKNIKIKNSATGIQTENSKNMSFLNLEITNSERGSIIRNSTDLNLDSATFKDLKFHGIQFLSSSNIAVKNSMFEKILEWECILTRDSKNIEIDKNSFKSSGVGMQVETSEKIEVTNNEFFNNTACILILEQNLNQTTVKENKFLACGSYTKVGYVNLRENP